MTTLLRTNPIFQLLVMASLARGRIVYKRQIHKPFASFCLLSFVFPLSSVSQFFVIKILSLLFLLKFIECRKDKITNQALEVLYKLKAWWNYMEEQPAAQQQIVVLPSPNLSFPL